MTDNYPAVKVLIKILTLSPILASPSSCFFLPCLFLFLFQSPFKSLFHLFNAPLLICLLLLFPAHLSFLFSFFSLPFFLLPIPFVHLLHLFCLLLSVCPSTSPSVLLLHVSFSFSVLSRLQEDPPTGVSGAPSENNIMLWNAVIFG